MEHILIITLYTVDYNVLSTGYRKDIYHISYITYHTYHMSYVSYVI